MVAKGRRARIVITGGGTAGHVFPALAIARALVDDGYETKQISFVGSRRGMEGELVRNAGYKIILLGGRGIVRRLSFANLPAIAGIFSAVFRSLAHLVRRRPRVVVSVGGYASVPCVIAAAILRIPVVVVNVDAVPGLANRLSARFAKLSAVAFENTPLRRAVVTGAPVRPEIERVSRSVEGRLAARARLGVPAAVSLVVVTGGSLGARRLNEATVDMALHFADREDLFIYHLVGERNLKDVSERVASGAVGSNYRFVAFSDEMPALLSAADLVVCRAGAMTVAELTVTGTPSILIPLPGAPNDHQTKNAQELVHVGAAVMMKDAVVDGETLGVMVLDLLADYDQLATMGSAARHLGKSDSARVIAGLVGNVVNEERRGSR